MAGIRETMEAFFAAAAFAECDCSQEALECLASVQSEPKRAQAKTSARKDSRPRVRV